MIGADLVYADSQIDALLPLLREVRHSLSRCRVLISHKCRNDAVDRRWFRELEAIGILPLNTGSSTGTPPFRILSNQSTIT